MSKYVDALNEKYNNGEINLKEKMRLMEEYRNSDKKDKTILSNMAVEAKKNKITLKRKKFNEKYSGYTENEIQMELLYAQQVTTKKLERIRSDTSKLVWFLIAIPIILGVLAGIFLS